MKFSLFTAVAFLAGYGAAAASEDLASTKVVPAGPALRGTRVLDMVSDTFNITELEELARQVQIGDDIEGLREQAFFGYSVAISTDGSIVAVGGANETDSGSVRIFKLGCGDSWNQIGQIVAGNDGDGFGYNIALASNGKEQGSVLAVHSLDQSSGFFGATVRVYQANGGGEWALRGVINDVTRSFPLTDSNLALSSAGDVLAVGSPFGANGDGSVLIYNWDGSSYRLTANITGVGGRSYGRSIDIDRSGTVLAVGSPGRRAPGYVQVFESNSGEWTERATITSEVSFDGFGSLVQLSSFLDDCIWNENTNTPGSILAVSRLGGDTPGIYIYEWDGATYNAAGEIRNDDNVGLGFYMSLASPGTLEGSVIAAGGFNATQVYEYSSGSWTQRGNDIDTQFPDGSFFPLDKLALSLDGNTLAIGLPYENVTSETGTLTSAGLAQIYDVSPSCFGGVFSWLPNSIAKGLRSWFV